VRDTAGAEAMKQANKFSTKEKVVMPVRCVYTIVGITILKENEQSNSGGRIERDQVRQDTFLLTLN
jgi:hypothetical protein